MNEQAGFSSRVRDNLREQLSKALPSVDRAGLAQDWQSVYVPQAHLRALSPRSMVVEGMRGSGKSFWTSVLASQDMRSNLINENLDGQFRDEMSAITQTHVIALDQTSSHALFPNPPTLNGLLMREGITPELIWQVALLRLFPIDPQLGMPLSADKFDPWTPVMKWAQANAGRVARAVDLLDEELSAGGQASLVVIDALDRVSGEFHLVTQMTSGLLRVMVQLRFAKALHLKAFLREDILSRAGPSVVDGSKILNNKASLEWTQVDLYGLLCHTLLQYSGAGTVRSTFEKMTKTKVQSRNGVYSSASIREGTSQEMFWITLVGDYMGRTATKGHSYPYMFNHLADGKGRVAPRTFLAAAAFAIYNTQESYADKQHVIHHEAIRDGVRHASDSRRRELEEEYKWVSPALQAIKDAGKTVPIDLKELQQTWGMKNGQVIAAIEKLRGTALLPWQEQTPPEDKVRLLHETMEQIGVIKIRQRQGVERVELPDIYRLAYRIGRPGGIATQQKRI